jgi:hypothetical protein
MYKTRLCKMSSVGIRLVKLPSQVIYDTTLPVGVYDHHRAPRLLCCNRVDRYAERTCPFEHPHAFFIVRKRAVEIDVCSTKSSHNRSRVGRPAWVTVYGAYCGAIV